MAFLKLFFLSLSCLILSSSLTAKDEISDASIREYIKQLGDDSYKVREKAIKALSNLPDTKRKLLIEELKSINNIEVQDRLKNILKLSEDRVIDILSELYLKAKKDYQDKKYEEATAGIQKIQDIEPDNEMAFELKIKIDQDLENYKDCIDSIKKLLNSNKKNTKEKTELQLNLSRILIEAGIYDEAIAILEKNPTTITAAINAFELLLTAYEANNQWEKAENALIKKNETLNTSQYTSALAWLYIRVGKLAKAQSYLESYISNIKNIDINGVLNYLFLEQNQAGLDKIKTITSPLVNSLKDKKIITFEELSASDILYLCYQYYFEKKCNLSTSIDFKNYFNAFSEKDKKIWPTPLLGLYSQELNFEKIEAQLFSGNKKEMRLNKCEAYFYYGLLKLTENNVAEAKKYFQLSKDLKVYEYVETTAANYFLQKLK